MNGCNLFVVAAPRSGSTQLAAWLNSHPDISVSLVKEPNHFSKHEFDPDYVIATHLNDIDPDQPVMRPTQFAVFRDPNSYAALFSGMRTLWRAEASTSYLSCPEAPLLIRRYAPNAQIVLLTRDPLQRALSHYRLALRTGRTTQSLKDEIADEQNQPLAARYLLRPSHQTEGVARFQAMFPNEQITVLTFENMIQNPDHALARIARTLGIQPDLFSLSTDARNAGAMPRLPRINSLMHQSGAKTILRRLTPAVAKPVLRRLWFNDSARAHIPASHQAALRRALDA